MIEKKKTFFEKFKEWWAVSLISFLIGLIPTWWGVAKDTYEYFDPGFKTVLTASTAWPANMICGGDSKTFSRNPLGLIVFIDITNTSKQPQRIRAYTIEENINNKWHAHKKNYCSTAILEFKYDNEYKYSEVKLFDDELSPKSIEAGGSVRGWTLFSKDENISKNQSSIGKLRLKIVNHNGDNINIYPIDTPIGISPVSFAQLKFISKPSWVK